jgi:hypothetical protein
MSPRGVTRIAKEVTMKTKMAGLCVALLAVVSFPKSARSQDSQNCNISGLTGCLIRENTSDGSGVMGRSWSGNGVQGFSTTSNASGVFGYNDSGGFGVTGQATVSGTAIYGYNPDGSGWAGLFDGRLYAASAYKPGGGSWTTFSDARLKKDIRGLEGVLDRLLRLRGVTYEWVEPEKQGNMTGRQIGMVAQEVEKVFPEWVGMDGSGYKTLTFRGFEALAVEGMRTLHDENRALRDQVGGLEDRIKRLESNRPAVVAGFGPSGALAACGIVLAVAALLGSKRRAATHGVLTK